MTNAYDVTLDKLLGPSRAPFAVVASDTVALPDDAKALYVGTGGHVVVRGIGAAADVTFKNVPSGAVLDVHASYVRATGTTAADIVGLA